MQGAAAPAASAPMTAPVVPPPMYVVEEPVAAAFVGSSVPWMSFVFCFQFAFNSASLEWNEILHDLLRNMMKTYLQCEVGCDLGPPLQVSAPSPMGSAATTVRNPTGFAHAVQKDAYVDLAFGNEVAKLVWRFVFQFS